MAIGNWGTDIVFRVSEREALLLQSLNRTVSAEWAAHSRIGLKNQSEFIRPGLQQVTFTMVPEAVRLLQKRQQQGQEPAQQHRLRLPLVAALGLCERHDALLLCEHRRGRVQHHRLLFVWLRAGL